MTVVEFRRPTPVPVDAEDPQFRSWCRQHNIVDDRHREVLRRLLVDADEHGVIERFSEHAFVERHQVTGHWRRWIGRVLAELQEDGVIMLYRPAGRGARRGLVVLAPDVLEIVPLAGANSAVVPLERRQDDHGERDLDARTTRELARTQPPATPESRANSREQGVASTRELARTAREPGVASSRVFRPYKEEVLVGGGGTPPPGDDEQRAATQRRLVAAGVQPGIAAELVELRGPAVVEAQLDGLPLRIEAMAASGKPVTNPAGLLIAAIRNDRPVPTPASPPPSRSPARSVFLDRCRQAQLLAEDVRGDVIDELLERAPDELEAVPPGPERDRLCDELVALEHLRSADAGGIGLDLTRTAHT